MSYLWVTIGSALGGLLRYTITRLTLTYSIGFPFGTILINVLGSFIIGYFGTLTLQNGRFPASDNLRLFVMVGICGGFTTFSAMSLDTFILLLQGDIPLAGLYLVLVVALSLVAAWVGHMVAARLNE